MTFQTVSANHQRLAIFQTQKFFWAFFIASWTMFAVGLVPIVYLFLMPAAPIESKFVAGSLSVTFQALSFCFGRALKQTRRWLADYYERAENQEKRKQIREQINSIEDQELRDQSRADYAKQLMGELRVSGGHRTLKNVVAQHILLRR